MSEHNQESCCTCEDCTRKANELRKAEYRVVVAAEKWRDVESAYGKECCDLVAAIDALRAARSKQ